MNSNFDPNIGKATQFRAGEEQAKVARKGGIASGRRRRFAKSILESVDIEASKVTTRRDGSQLNGNEAIGAALMAKAVRGDIQAIRIILELRGELVKQQKVELSGGVETTTRKEMSVAEARKMMDDLYKQYGLS